MDCTNQREAGKQFCERNLRECCEEILEWETTGTLRNGKVRLLAKISDYAGDDALSVAAGIVKRTAMQAASK